jgi:hypothetical protein
MDWKTSSFSHEKKDSLTANRVGGSARLRSQGRLGTVLRSLKKESDNLLAGGETEKCSPGEEKTG